MPTHDGGSHVECEGTAHWMDVNDGGKQYVLVTLKKAIGVKAGWGGIMPIWPTGLVHSNAEPNLHTV